MKKYAAFIKVNGKGCDFDIEAENMKKAVNALYHEMECRGIDADEVERIDIIPFESVL